MREKKLLLDEIGINRAISRISHEIIERNKGVDNLCLVGIVTRGVPFAKLIQQNIDSLEGVTLPIGKLNISSFRDDIDVSIIENKETGLDIKTEGKDVVLCDDVIFTGRTVRAAIEAVMKNGRPKTIQLAVLIDRGHRELPIRPDYVGKNIPTSRKEKIETLFPETDGKQLVYISSEQ